MIICKENQKNCFCGMKKKSLIYMLSILMILIVMVYPVRASDGYFYELNKSGLNGEQDGTMKMPVVIHRAIFGSFERFIGIIIEHFKGSFPFWLCPVQVGIVHIRVENNAYAEEVAEVCRKNDIRFEADYSDKNMKEKIKAFRNMRDPYVLVLGNNEAENRTVSINIRGGKQLKDVPLDKFVSICRAMNESRCLEITDTLE